MSDILWGLIILLFGIINCIYMIYIGNIVLLIISIELCSLGILLLLIDYIYNIEYDIDCIFLLFVILGMSGINSAINITVLIKIKMFI